MYRNMYMYIYRLIGIYNQIIIFDNPTFYESNMSVAILKYRMKAGV